MLFRLRNLFFVAAFPIVVCGSFLTADAGMLYAAPLKVVATQNYFADLAREIGKDRVEVRAVASPKFNVHFIQPKPSDVRNVAKADLVVHNGLDLEAWWGPLVEAAGRPEFFPGGAKSTDLSAGIPLLGVPDRSLTRAEGDIHAFGNPHYPLDPRNAKLMAATLRKKLAEADPANAAFYEANEKEFAARLDAKIAEWKTACAHCAGKEIVSYHDDIAYFADFLGLRAREFVEPKPGVPPTPKHLQFLGEYMKEKNVKAVAMPTYYSRSAAEALAKKTGARVVTVCQNVGEEPETGGVIAFFDRNIRKIAEALA